MSGILLASVGNSYAIQPVNLTVPVVSGTETVGSTLTSTTGTWTGTPTPTYTYQWQRGVSNISGATSSSYTIQVADAGSTLRCVVTATNVAGSASANSASTGVIPTPWSSGQTEYTVAGAYSFIPVSPMVSVVCIGGGGSGRGAAVNLNGHGGGGGGLGYKNDYPVTPGTPYTVVVGKGATGSGNTPAATLATSSYFDSPLVVMGGLGAKGGVGGAGGIYVGDGGGNGGEGGNGGGASAGGGGGTGGYSGTGGAGGPTPGTRAGQAGSGGGAGGGGAGGDSDFGGAGGGVNIYGQGANGAGGGFIPGPTPVQDGLPGFGGSGGGNGTDIPGPGRQDDGGFYGGGGGGVDGPGSGSGSGGAVRVIWGAPGVTRRFPSTNTGNL